MKKSIIKLNLRIDDEICEHVEMPILVPEGEIESDLLCELIRRELKDDLGDVDTSDPLLISRFHKTVAYIRYKSNGRFIFDHYTNSGLSMGEGFFFYIHPYRSQSDPDLPDPPPTEFELIYVQQGVGYSLYEESIIEDLMRCLK